ncbi:MAG: hypothetical protein VYD39_01450 [Bacteroidota bacterium]|nr:hypothetical protein [Bacteroidota bacterium]
MIAHKNHKAPRCNKNQYDDDSEISENQGSSDESIYYTDEESADANMTESEQTTHEVNLANSQPNLCK